MNEQPKETRMRIGPHGLGGDDWPHCMATIIGEETENKTWEFVFPVPIPEKLWEVRARWPIGGSYWKHLVQRGTTVELGVVDGHVEKVVVGAKVSWKNELELDLNSPGPPFEPTNYHSGPGRDACLVDSIKPGDYDSAFVEGTCENCEEEVPEGANTCPECGASQSQEAPTVGELAEKYGPEARVYVSWHARDVSLHISYTLDDAGLAKEKAEIQAKYDAEMTEYELLKVEWDELAEKVNAYNVAEDEANDRAKLAELKAQYEA